MVHYHDYVYASRKEERKKGGYTFPFQGKTWKLHTSLMLTSPWLEFSPTTSLTTREAANYSLAF